MNLLLINHYAGSPHYGMEYRPYYLAREWVREGHEVTIVAAEHSHVRHKQPTLSSPITEEWIDGIRYVWLRARPYAGNGPGRVLNIFDFVTLLSRRWRQVLGSTRPDAVIASSTYPLDIYPARRIAAATGARLIFEVHDLWPLSLVDLAGMSPKHPFIVLLSHAEAKAYRTADKVVSLLPKTRDYMISRGMNPDRWHWVPNGVDLSEWRQPGAPLPEEHRRFFAEAKSQGAFVVGYAGGHGISNGLDTLIDAAAGLANNEVRVVLVGKGPERERLRESAKGTCAYFLPAVPKPMIPGLLANMDALYLGFRDEPLYRFGVCPNKLMDYMMSEKPIIYAINGHDDTVDRAQCGVTIPAEDPAALISAVKRLSTTPPAALQAMGERGRCHVERYHDYSVLARSFLDAVR